MTVLSKIKDNEKKVKFSYTVHQRHWVGDGFHVHNLLRPSEEINKYVSPFVLIDYASPKEFPKTTKVRGVGKHPHRGFETVTLAYQGEVEHRDSSGGGGVIKPGDVQWMTAGSGIIHEEYHSSSFSREGGVFEMVQLWVNLPKRDKMTAPKYQGIENKNIPKVKLGEKSAIRVIAGAYQGEKGPSSTFSPINMYDISSIAKENVKIKLKHGTNTILLIMSGEVELEGKTFSEKSVLIFEQAGEELHFTLSENFKGLILNGEPINEPIVAHGPFVMNTSQEITQAIRDYQNGRMGKL